MMGKNLILLFVVLLACRGESAVTLDQSSTAASATQTATIRDSKSTTTGNSATGNTATGNSATGSSAISNATTGNATTAHSTAAYSMSSHSTAGNSTGETTVNYSSDLTSSSVNEPLSPKVYGSFQQETEDLPKTTKRVGTSPTTSVAFNSTANFTDFNTTEESTTPLSIYPLSESVRERSADQKNQTIDAVNATRPTISKSKPRFLSNFSSGGDVLGVATLSDDTFVLHDDSAAIRVYDRNFELKLTMTISSIPHPYDMVSITFTENLFFLDSSTLSSVIRVRADRRFDSSKWLISESTVSTSALSVTPEKYILVTDLTAPKIKEFLPSGVLLKVVNLATSALPLHAVKLDINSYAVSFGKNSTDKHQVCLFDENGKQTGVCYGNEMGSGDGQLNQPTRMLVTDRSTILIVDSFNHRVVEVDFKLAFVKVLLSDEDGLKKPCRITHDKWRGLLLVGDNGMEDEAEKGGRILAFRI